MKNLKSKTATIQTITSKYLEEKATASTSLLGFKDIAKIQLAVFPLGVLIWISEL